MKTNLVEEAVEVHVNTFPSERVKEDVFSVAIAQTQDVAHHGHHSSGAAVCRATAVPVNTQWVTLLVKNPEKSTNTQQKSS